MENEIWRDVVGYEENYKISNKGKMFAKGFETIAFNGKRHVSYEKEMRLLPTKQGYKAICLYNENGHKRFLVHRIVAIAFIPNVEFKNQVNHINGIKDDNRVENLEWSTCSENIRHAYDILKRKGSATGNFNRIGVCKSVNKILNGIIVKSYPSASEAVRQNEKINNKQGIFKAIKNKTKCGGYNWNYKL